MSDEFSEIKKKLEEQEQRIAGLEKLLQTKPREIRKKLSIREFILSKNPESEMEKTLAIGYYLEKYGSFTIFNAEDLVEGFRRAKEKILGNINYQVIRSIQRGYMTEAQEKKDKRKAWYLTNSGVEHVENDFWREK